jgi:hypothetical protein
MFLTYARFFSLFVNFPLTMMFSLSFTLLFSPLRIARPGSQFITANLRMVYITSYLCKCLHLNHKHSLVRGLLHIVGTTVWDIQLFGRSTLFYPSFSFLFYPMRHRYPALSVRRQRVTNCSFSVSKTSICNPLDLIYSDVWGPSPTISINGNMFYVSFVDAFSQFTWVYPIQAKFDVTQVFLNFQSMVERLLNAKNKICSN